MKKNSSEIEVLLVEDNPNDLELALHAFKQVKMANHIHVARDGAEALEFIFGTDPSAAPPIADRPFIILLDLKLPKVSGLEVLQRIKGDPRTQMIPVVVLTSSAEQRDLVESYKLGVNSYIVKPVDFEQFTEVVRQSGFFWLLINHQPEKSGLGDKKGMSTPLRVLILEDNAYDVEMALKELVRAGFAVESKHVETERDFAANLHAGLDIIMGDFRLPGWDGLQALRLLQESGLDIPFIVVSGTIDEEVAVELIKQGATDYLLKDRLTRLGPAVEKALEKRRILHERRQAENALEQLRRQYELILGSVGEGIHGIDCAGNITFENPASERLLGWEHGEILGESAHATFHHSRVPGMALPPEECQILATIRDGIARQVTDEVFWRKDGTFFPVEYLSSPILNEKGEIAGCVVTFHDITEKKKLEEQFLRAQRLDSIGTLASGVAHDLNNILAPIMMSAAMLREDLPPAAYENIITTIEDSAQRGADIVKQVLAFAKGVQGQRIAVQPEEVIGEIEKITLETFPKSITVKNNTSPGIRKIVGDPTQMHQVLLNLCINARDAMPGGGTLTLSAENMEIDESYAAMIHDAKPGSYVVLRVTDTGTGIPREIIDKIFDPFFTTKAPGSGTGLGLSTVIGIVKSHGGFVKIDTEIGKGTAFHVFLPAGTHVQNYGDRPIAPAGKGNGELILVVDDEAEIRKMMHAILSRSGYQVIVAQDGNEALIQYSMQAGTVKAVVTDLMMPLTDGVVLTRALKRINPNAQIIASSGAISESQVTELKELGVELILRKPYTGEKLLNALDATIHGNSFDSDF